MLQPRVAMGERLRLLVVATKSPYPPVGGGSATLHALLLSLAARGLDIHVVASGPAPADAPRAYEVRTTNRGAPRWRGLGTVVLGHGSASLVRFQQPALAELVESELAAFDPHVVHLEQLHVAWLLPRLARTRPTVLRQQNVESLLLARLAAISGPHVRWLLRLEAAHVARAEARACALADVVAAISQVDADRLARLRPGLSPAVLPAAWSSSDPPARERLGGEPAFLCLGSFDWWPNRDGALWLLHQVWPIIRARAPGAVLHLAGPASRSLPTPSCGGVERRGMVARAADLYDPDGIVLVPLRAGSGVRLRLLEAWDAGVPVVTTPVGGEGLVPRDGDGAILAASAPAFAGAALQLATDAAQRSRLGEEGRERLKAHTAVRVAARATVLYDEARARWARRSKRS